MRGNHWKVLLVMFIAALFTVSWVSCATTKPQPAQSEHPKGEHPKGEHPKGEHPKGEHPKGEHPSSHSDAGAQPTEGADEKKSDHPSDHPK